MLQKANAYEKMALFGSRKNFLTALAQEAGVGLNGTQKQQLEGIGNNLSVVSNPTARTLANKLLDYLRNPSPDLTQLAGDLRQAANLFPGNNTTAVQNALDLAQSLQGSAVQPGEGEQVMRMPADRITGFAPIPTDVQEKLSEMLAVRGDYIPFKADGKLGPETKKALDIYQAKYNNGSKLPPGEQLYNEIRKSYNMWSMQQKYEAGEYNKPAEPGFKG